MKVNLRGILSLVLIVLLVIAAVSLLNNSTKKAELTYGELISYFKDDAVVSFNIDNNLKISVVHFAEQNGSYNYDESKCETDTYQLSYSFQLEEINGYTKTNSNLKDYNYKAAQSSWVQLYLPYILMFLAFVGLWIFVMRSANGGMGKIGNFSKSKAKVTYNDKNPVRFVDVAGADEEKAELEEVVEFLKDPSRFTKLGARIPRGVLLVGPPGTGKTLLAKAVAGEAGVPFFSISGSDFVEMYVGVGASRVRDLFDSARRVPASIIFIDEIDAVGRHRGAGLGGGHDEREQTLNQLLVEMDGFGTQSGVIVLAATNRPDILDPALLRPGRFDRRVTVGYPDIKGREDILHVHSRNKPLEATVDFKRIAESTIGFTGADLANLLNEAAIRAAKKGKALIGMEDIDESYLKMLLGPQKKVNHRTFEDNNLVAYHEAGHAVLAYCLPHADPVKHITIVPAGNAGGVTVNPPVKDHVVISKNQMLDEITMCLGGRIAEELIVGDMSTGASSDIQKATATARNMITRYGMSEKLGTILYGSEHSDDEVFLGRDFSSGKNYSEKTAALIDDEIHDCITSCYNKGKELLTMHIDKLHFIAQYLLKHESMDGEQFEAAMSSENPTVEEIEAIAENKRKNSDDENKVAHENNAKAEAEAKARADEEAARMKENPTEENGDFLNDFFNNNK